MKKNVFKLNYTEKWDEGAPIGNGKIGSLVYGGNPLAVTADRADLWDLRPNPTTLEKGFNYKNLFKLSQSPKKEDWEERARLFEDIYDEKPYPSKITAGRLELRFEKEPADVSYAVDMTDGFLTVFSGKEEIAEIFTCRSGYVGAIRTTGNAVVSFNIPSYLSDENVLGYPAAAFKADGDYIWFEQKTHTDFAFGIFVLKKGNEIFYTLSTSSDDKNYVDYAKRLLKTHAETGFNELKKQNAVWWHKYWKKSFIKTNDKIIDDVYMKSTYLLACTSRKGGYPMALQGVWTCADDKLPPWRGDYHHDTNTQLSYQSYLKANRLDEGRAFIDYLWSLRGEFRKFAKSFYGVNGLLIPGVSTLDGKPMGGWAQYSLSPTMTIWSAQSFDEYYIYTGDESFLKNRAYPFFKEVGKAITDILEEKDGKLYLKLSTSPEIFDNTQKAYLKPNSNFDLSLLIYLYKTLVDYSKKLGTDYSEYENILSKLDDIAVNENGQVLLDKNTSLEETHRHFSHYMCLYPLHLINYDTDEHKKIYERAIFDIERLGTGMWVGFSFAMAAQIYAMAKKGNGAYENLYKFCNGFVGENGFHLNGDLKITVTRPSIIARSLLKVRSVFAMRFKKCFCKTTRVISRRFPPFRINGKNP